MAPAIRSLLRSAVIVVTILAWAAISNHCALAAWATTSQAAEACPMHPKPAQGDQGSGLICCKILRAESGPAATKVVPQAQILCTMGAEWTASLGEWAALHQPVATRQDGPPGLGSFAEAVLQRSLLAHAPPALG